MTEELKEGGRDGGMVVLFFTARDRTSDRQGKMTMGENIQ